MARRASVTTALVSAFAAALVCSMGIVKAGEQVQSGVEVAAADLGSRFVPLGVGKSVVIDLPRDVKDVLVANPEIANAVVRSTRRAYLIGVKVGQTNVYFFDADGRQIAGFDIAVKRDLNGLRAGLKHAFPNADITAEGVADGVMRSALPQARPNPSRPTTSPLVWSATRPRSPTTSPSRVATR